MSGESESNTLEYPPPELLAYVLPPKEKVPPQPRDELARSPYTWDRFNAAASNDYTAGLMEALGWTITGTTRDGTVTLERPGKDEGSTSATVGAVAPGVLYVHTSSDDNFDDGRPYDAADVYAVLHHDGDRAAAEKALQGSVGGERRLLSDAEVEEGMRAWRERCDVEAERQREAVAVEVASEWDALSMTLAELAALPPLEWVVDGLIPATEYAVVYGPPKAGKTFTLIDMALRLATGRDWHGATTRQQKVIYLVGEGIRGYQRRVAAWEAANGAVNGTIEIVNAAGKNLRDADTRAGLIEFLRRKNATTLIIDTINRLSGGMDENSPEGMGEFNTSCDEMRAAVDNLTIIAAHHTGKDVKAGMRGHSSLLGAVGAGILVTKHADRLVTVRLEDAREAEPGLTKAFELHTPEGHDTPALRLTKEEAKEYDASDQLLLTLLGSGPMTKPEIRAALDESSPRVTDRLDRLTKAKKVIFQAGSYQLP